MSLLAQLRFYCDPNDSCDKFTNYRNTTYCAHNRGVPFSTERICTNKEVHKQIIQDLLNYSPGPNNG